eukprot:TRINITY_DN70057_c0_g1_i1.p1 TRINITY_DN70057_c0_g1~~TRINITY_DN70057_c0_g1_i1.p1  ORF type:complete len:486 (+),score=157.46 TRINITY_DN70057_c0_g1_i1:80-1459(+)
MAGAPSERVQRSETSTVLGKLAHRRALEPLIGALAESSSRVHINALTLLAEDFGPASVSKDPAVQRSRQEVFCAALFSRLKKPGAAGKLHIWQLIDSMLKNLPSYKEDIVRNLLKDFPRNVPWNNHDQVAEYMKLLNSWRHIIDPATMRKLRVQTLSGPLQFLGNQPKDGRLEGWRAEISGRAAAAAAAPRLIEDTALIPERVEPRKEQDAQVANGAPQEHLQPGAGGAAVAVVPQREVGLAAEVDPRAAGQLIGQMYKPRYQCEVLGMRFSEDKGFDEQNHKDHLYMLYTRDVSKFAKVRAWCLPVEDWVRLSDTRVGGRVIVLRSSVDERGTAPSEHAGPASAAGAASAGRTARRDAGGGAEAPAGGGIEEQLHRQRERARKEQHGVVPTDGPGGRSQKCAVCTESFSPIFDQADNQWVLGDSVWAWFPDPVAGQKRKAVHSDCYDDARHRPPKRRR